MSITSRNINRFHFTARLSTNYDTKFSLHILPHLKNIAASPCETIMLQKLQKFKNTVLVCIDKILLKLVK